MVSRSKIVKVNWLLVLFIGFHTAAVAQNYYGIQGSPYAGSLGIVNNPASMLNTPFTWDLDIFSFQTKYSTNAVEVRDWSLLSSPANSKYLIKKGDYSRYAYADYNINILNARIALNRRTAIGFGMNVRGYVNGSTFPFNYQDSIKSSRGYFSMDNFSRKMSGDVTSSSWIELFGSIAQTVWDRPDSRLNVGITGKVSRGISGVYTNIQNGQVQPTIHDNDVIYTMRDVTAEYGYSYNYDLWKKEKSTSQNIRDFLTESRGGVSLDLGVEYIIKPTGMGTSFDDDEGYYDYDWKIGLSILDIGFNQYRYGTHSRRLSGFYEDVADSLIDTRFKKIKNLAGFNDSIYGIIRNIVPLGGMYKMANPTRMVLNVDRYLFDNFYVNGNLSVNISSVWQNQSRVSELNRLTITPRWETSKLGAYLPVQFNKENKLWVGGAVKAGPLILGIHNFANLFSQKKMANGGGYLAIVVRAGKSAQKHTDRRLECP